MLFYLPLPPLHDFRILLVVFVEVLVSDILMSHVILILVNVNILIEFGDAFVGTFLAVSKLSLSFHLALAINYK